MRENVMLIDGVRHREKPFAYCCAEGGGSVEGCDCVNRNHGTAWTVYPEAEWREKFKERMLEAGPTFDDGSSIADYADDVSESYWHDLDESSLDPREAAEADMSYWGEE